MRRPIGVEVIVELDRNPGKSMLETTEITPEVVTHVIDRIAQRVRPLKIILFGSHTKQAASQGSDLDLFVVQDGRVSNRRLRREIERLLCQRRFGLDLIVRTQEEFELNLRDGNPFYVEEIVGSGRVVYERSA